MAMTATFSKNASCTNLQSHIKSDVLINVIIFLQLMNNLTNNQLSTQVTSVFHKSKRQAFNKLTNFNKKIGVVKYDNIKMY